MDVDLLQILVLDRFSLNWLSIYRPIDLVGYRSLLVVCFSIIS